MNGKPTLAIIGGTGALGSGLARRWAAAGYDVIIGSRTADKAEAVARTIASATGGAQPARHDQRGGGRDGRRGHAGRAVGQPRGDPR